MRSLRLVFLLAPAVLAAQTAAPLSDVQKEFFETNIRPVLSQSCGACHGDSKMGGLRVLSKDDLLKGGASGPAIAPGDPAQSLLISRIQDADAKRRMPKGGAALSEPQVANFVRWVKDGAYWPVESATASNGSKAKFFEDNVRPVLAFQCFTCHTTSAMGGLKLDTREAMLKGGKSGPALAPGDPEKSLLISAVRRTNPALMMPKNGSALTPAQIADLENWVRDGAVWPDAPQQPKFSMTEAQRNLWSIRPLKKPEIPKIRDSAWALNDVDRFIFSKLESQNLKPAPVATRRELLRRASYDLLGLPATYQEVTAFEADKSPNAWEKVIDRLQASPRYGEKWARHWEDLVRFGEDDYNAYNANRSESYKFAYTYRDWLIHAFNDDMPYDTFVRMQLAGDLMDEKVRDKAMPALGMNGLGVWHMMGMAAQIERADDWADRVDVTTKAFLGLTVACARCHDHKYDAIPTKDFYRLAGIFASSPYTAYPLVDKSTVAAYEKKKKEIAEREKELKDLVARATELESSVLFLRTESYMLAAWRVGSEKGATVETVANQDKLDSEVLGRWVNFLKKPPNNYGFLKPWQAMVARGGSVEEVRKLAHDFYTLVDGINKEKAKVKQENETMLAKTTDPNAKELFDPLPNDNKRSLNIYLLELKGIPQEEGQLWTDIFDHDLPDPTKVSNAGAGAFGYRGSAGLLKFTDYALEKRLPADWAAQIDTMRNDIASAKKSLGEHYPFAYGIGEAEKPVDLRVFVRGNPDVFGDQAPRGFLAMLSDGDAKPYTQGSGRLELANDILKQPIAARVIANRVWGWVMGSGIVLTANNFGIAGSAPSNPELLDYLAARFLADGMSIKKLEKLIMMSRTYQLSTETIGTNTAKDPDNRFCWRSNTRRLDAEGVWDYLLTYAGKLDLTKTGGPSAELADGMLRRGVYGVSSRMFPNQFQLTFDFLTPTISVERRYTTTIPQQRLFLLNSPMVHDDAEALAARVSREATEEGCIRKAFEIVYQRQPSAGELAASVQFLHNPELIKLTGEPAGDARTPEAKPAPSAESSERGEGAPEEPRPMAQKGSPIKAPRNSPLKSLCWALLSSNEFLYIN
jgi:mono/diheme cytochrome c family protein